MKYQKKPVIIEAIQVSWANWNKLCDFLGDDMLKKINEKMPTKYTKDYSETCGEDAPYIELIIPTLEGDFKAKHGDFIIKGVKGEYYPCKPDIFRETYTPVE